MSATQLALFTAPIKGRAIPAHEQAAIREAANLAYFSAKREYFRLACREMGGYTAKTRHEVDERVEHYARQHAELRYREAGYAECLNFDECHRLTTPIVLANGTRTNYPLCPGCEANIGR